MLNKNIDRKSKKEQLAQLTNLLSLHCSLYKLVFIMLLMKYVRIKSFEYETRLIRACWTRISTANRKRNSFKISLLLYVHCSLYELVFIVVQMKYVRIKTFEYGTRLIRACWTRISIANWKRNNFKVTLLLYVLCSLYKLVFIMVLMKYVRIKTFEYGTRLIRACSTRISIANRKRNNLPN